MLWARFGQAAQGRYSRHGSSGQYNMIELGLDKTVVRKPVESRASYRDLVVDAILAAASGNGDSTGGAASGLEMASSRWARALASARASHPSVTPQLLSDIGRATL